MLYSALIYGKLHQLHPLFQQNGILFDHEVTPGAIAYEIDDAAAGKIFFRDGDFLPYEKFKPWITGNGAASQESELAIGDANL